MNKKLTSSELKNFFNGLILGDGSIGKGVTKRSFEIKSINKDFIDYIEDTVKNITNFKYYIKYIEAKTKDGVHRKEHWIFTICSHPYFNKRYNHFYDDIKQRRISREVIRDLSPITLANWYMSDGYVCLVGKNSGSIIDRRVDISTDRYNKEDLENVIIKLKEKFNIVASLNKRGDNYRIRISKASYSIFFEMIYPYIVPSMKYKCYLGYNHKPSFMSDRLFEIQKEVIEVL